MTDPYRTPGYLCPGCKSAGMRQLGTRLICDHCEGMMLQPDDLAGNLGASDIVEVRDGAPIVEKTCPRCGGDMRACDLQINQRTYNGYVHCPTDGVWFEADRLIALFGDVSRRDHGGGGTHHGVVSDGGYLGGRRDQRPLRFAIPTSPFDGQRLTCPVCAGALQREHDRWPCGGCRGVFVENGALEAMVMDMVGQPWSMPTPTGAAGERGCPVCATKMVVEQFEAVTVDRCADHGIWFDPTELGAALHHAGSDTRRGIIGWLKRVF